MSLLVKIDPRPATSPVVSHALPERLIAGAPEFSTWAQDEATAGNGRVRSGIWQATPGETHSLKGETCEFCHILEGLVEITEKGKPPVRFSAGDSFVMKPGFVGVWKTIETVRKIYVVVG
jgi:uncharacterized protein